jgi:WhiB family transcriptional regulator, redox-sensing transcriptional regulator
MMHEREPAVTDDLSLAQGMSDWFADYLYGTIDEPGVLPPLTVQRLRRQFGEGEPNDQMAIIRDNLMLFDDSDQYNIATYICGYPDEALNVLAGDDIHNSLLMLDRQFEPPTEIDYGTQSSVRRPQAERLNPVVIEAVRRAITLRMNPTSRTVARVKEILAFRLPVHQSDSDADPIMHDFEWRSRAECLKSDPEIFSSTSSELIASAKEICNGCSVIERCLAHAQLNREAYGTWGGLSANERLRLRRNEKKAAERVASNE